MSKNWFNENCNNIKDDELRILQLAGEIITRNKRCQVYRNNYYFANDKMYENLDGYIPKSLNFLRFKIILKDKKSKPDKMSLYNNKCKSIAHTKINLE